MYEALQEKDNKSRSVTSSVAHKKSNMEKNFGFVDNRPEVVTQRKLQEVSNCYSAKQECPSEKKENKTGLPDNLKSGIGYLSGYSKDDKKVHYNSSQPAQLKAHAYAQGTDIHIASGQESYLPREAWHVIQKKQERVQPTMQMEGEMYVNNNSGVEDLADVMGEHASTLGKQNEQMRVNGVENISRTKISSNTLQNRMAVIQGAWVYLNNRNGEHLNLRYIENGVYALGLTSRRFRQIDNGPPIIVTEITGEERPTSRRRFEPPSDGVNMARRASQRDWSINEPETTGSRRHNTSDSNAVTRHNNLDNESTNGNQSRNVRGNNVENSRSQSDLRTAFREARTFIEQNIGRELTEQEWDVIADHPVDSIRGMRQCGIGPVDSLSGPSGASCIPTSDRIYGLLRQSEQVQQNADNNTQQRLEALATSIEGENENSIYQVVFNPSHHGFVIVVIEDHAEVTQSFANSESLGTNLSSGNFSFTRAQVSNYLRNFLDSRQTNRAQIAMFEGRIDGTRADRHPITDMQVSWHRSSLREDSNMVIRTELSQRTIELLNPRNTIIGSDSRSESRRTSLTNRRSNTQGRQNQQALAPNIIAGNNLNAGGMILHYFNAIAWANGGNTYSDEFHWVRNSPALASALLQQGGMTAGTAQAFTQRFAQAVQNFDQQLVNYVQPGVQEQIMQTLGVEEQLFAIIRYLQNQEG